MSTIQDTLFSKNNSSQKKKFDIQNLNFKNLGIKFKNVSNTTSQNLPENSNEGKDVIHQDKRTTYYEDNRENDSRNISRRINPNEEKNKEEVVDLNNNKLLNKTVENLRIALSEKNEEISILKRNFKEKINLIENENKKQVDNLETKYKLHIDNLVNTYESKIKEIESRQQQYLNEFDENYARFQKEINIFLSLHIEKSVHEDIVTKLNNSWNEKFENVKSLFNKKLKEMMNFFDKPEYRILMEKIKFYTKFNEKLHIEFKENERGSMNELKNDEIELLISKMKIHMIDVETRYLKGLSEMEQKYQELESKFHQSKADDKLENLKKIVLDKFSFLENINFLGNQENMAVPHKNSSAQILSLLNEFKNKKKIFSHNLETDFNFTTSFIKEYDIKNKEIKTEEFDENRNKKSDNQSNLNKPSNTDYSFQKKLSLFSSEMEKNNIYDEENFTKFDYPKILVNPNMKHFDDFKSGDHNLSEISNNRINSSKMQDLFIDENQNDYQSMNSKDINYIRLKTKK